MVEIFLQKTDHRTTGHLLTLLQDVAAGFNLCLHKLQNPCQRRMIQKGKRIFSLEMKLAKGSLNTHTLRLYLASKTYTL